MTETLVRTLQVPYQGSCLQKIKDQHQSALADLKNIFKSKATEISRVEIHQKRDL